LVGRKLKVIKMSIFERYKQEISPEFASQLMLELSKDYLKNNPCKWKKGRIALWEVTRARIEDLTHQSRNILF
jgi:hypothetical protein